MELLGIKDKKPLDAEIAPPRINLITQNVLLDFNKNK